MFTLFTLSTLFTLFTLFTLLTLLTLFKLLTLCTLFTLFTLLTLLTLFPWLTVYQQLWSKKVVELKRELMERFTTNMPLDVIDSPALSLQGNPCLYKYKGIP